MMMNKIKKCLGFTLIIILFSACKSHQIDLMFVDKYKMAE